jgi:DNA-binding CsgD family transcriptional regulator
MNEERGMLNDALQDDAELQSSIDSSTQSRLLTALMDRLECGVLACGPHGELYHANVAARRELEGGRLLREADRCVRATPASQGAWAAALHDAAVRLRSSLVSIEDGEERLMVALLPVHVDGIDGAAAVAMMGRRVVCSPLGLEMLSSSHGLTFAERRVFRALVGNRNAREIADAHGVGLATVRSQIQAVRDKLGVRSIDALLLRAAQVPPVTTRY